MCGAKEVVVIGATMWDRSVRHEMTEPFGLSPGGGERPAHWRPAIRGSRLGMAGGAVEGPASP